MSAVGDNGSNSAGGDNGSNSSSILSQAFESAGSISKDLAGNAFGIANFNLVKLDLARHAAAKTVVNTDVKNKAVVVSPHISRMLDAYELASGGGVLVLCAPSDSGKTCAAEYLMLGDHAFRPDQSLMISAVAMKNFAVEFADLTLGCKKAGPFLSKLLCQALATDPGSVQGSVAKAGKVASMGSCKASEAVAFNNNTPLSSYGPNDTYTSEPIETFQRLPVLILDNFNEESQENTTFVKNLLQDATDHEVLVFILTKESDWASKMVKLNGGTKIKPLFGNVNNPDYSEVGTFSGEPDWNTLGWDVETLRELIRPQCVKNSLDPIELIPDRAVVGPREAKAKVHFELRKRLRDARRGN
jgi:hypothetical protein